MWRSKGYGGGHCLLKERSEDMCADVWDHIPGADTGFRKLLK